MTVIKNARVAYPETVNDSPAFLHALCVIRFCTSLCHARETSTGLRRRRLTSYPLRLRRQQVGPSVAPGWDPARAVPSVTASWEPLRHHPKHPHLPTQVRDAVDCVSLAVPRLLRLRHNPANREHLKDRASGMLPHVATQELRVALSLEQSTVAPARGPSSRLWRSCYFGLGSLLGRGGSLGCVSSKVEGPLTRRRRPHRPRRAGLQRHCEGRDWSFRDPS